MLAPQSLSASLRSPTEAVTVDVRYFFLVVNDSSTGDFFFFFFSFCNGMGCRSDMT